MPGAQWRRPGALVMVCLARAGLVAVSALAHAQHAGPAAARSSVATPERVTQNERLAILGNERNDVLARLAKATKDADSPAIARVRDDLAALDREIAAVGREPVYEIKISTPARVAKVSAEKLAEESQQATNEPIHASWDVFKNFGKGSK